MLDKKDLYWPYALNRCQITNGFKKIIAQRKEEFVNFGHLNNKRTFLWYMTRNMFFGGELQALAYLLHMEGIHSCNETKVRKYVYRNTVTVTISI